VEPLPLLERRDLLQLVAGHQQGARRGIVEQPRRTLLLDEADERLTHLHEVAVAVDQLVADPLADLPRRQLLGAGAHPPFPRPCMNSSMSAPSWSTASE